MYSTVIKIIQTRASRIVLALFLAGRFALAQEPAFSIPVEKRKEFVVAATLPGFSLKVLSYVKNLGDANDALSAIDDIMPLAVSPEDRVALLREKASVLEMLGSWKPASAAWSTAYSSAPDNASRIEYRLFAAVCLLNAGESSGALGLIDSVDYSLLGQSAVHRFKLVSAWAEHMRGNNLKSSVLAAGVLASDNSFLRFQALLLMYGASAGAEKDDYAGEIALLLKKNPELADSFAPYMLTDIAILSRITASAEPVKTDPASSAAAGVKDAGDPKFYQIGAFSSDENAKSMIERLKVAGIVSSLATKKSAAGTLYIVFVEGGKDPARLVLQLKDAGFEAWPLPAAP